jgi:hypothetical protein
MYGILSKNMHKLFSSMAIKAINDNGFKVGELRLQQYQDITKIKFTVEYDVKQKDRSYRLDSKTFEIKYRTGGLFRMLNDNGYNSMFTSLSTNVEQLLITKQIMDSYPEFTTINFNKGTQ